MTKNVIQKPTTSYALLAQAEKQKARQNGIAAAAKEKAVPVNDDSGADKAKMVKIIEYMNKINGAGKTVDAVPTVDALCEKYGDKAATLLLYAVNEPYKYADYIGDKSIKTSRAALTHLCSLEGEKEQLAIKGAEEKAAGREPSAEQVQKRQNQAVNTDKAQSAAQTLKAGHDRVTAMRDKLRQGHTEANDNTCVSNRVAAAERLRFEQSSQHYAGNRQPITAEAMRKLLADRMVHQ